jgi:hypothetical protein
VFKRVTPEAVERFRVDSDVDDRGFFAVECGAYRFTNLGKTSGLFCLKRFDRGLPA